MNEFLAAAKAAISLHGANCTYTRISAGVYDAATGASTNTSTTHSIKAYKKHIKASQFNYPNLIGKESAMFYIASDSLAFVPKVKDKISYGSQEFVIDSFQEHIAKGQVVLYRIVAVLS